MTILTQNYAETLDILVARYLVDGQMRDIEKLVAALGCRYSDDHDNLFEPAQPSSSDEYLVRATLKQAILWHGSEKGYTSDGFALLDGLIRHDRWRQYLTSIDGAHALSVLLLDFCIGVPYAKDLQSAVKPGVLRLLNEWLRPDEPFAELLAPEVLARSLFGDAWCDIGAGVGVVDNHIGVAVLRSKPPFRPGLLAEHLNDRIEQLPDLGHL